MPNVIEISIRSTGLAQVASAIRSVNSAVTGMKDQFRMASAAIQRDLMEDGRAATKMGAEIRAAGVRAREAGANMATSAGHAGRLSGALESVQGSAASMGHAIMTAAALTVSALGAATLGVVGFGIKSAAAMETSAVSFTLMLGSAQKAKAFLKQLQQFAVVTPFELADLQVYASRLLAVGVNANNIIPILRRIGDATAAVGTGSFGIERAVNALNNMKLAGDVSMIHLKELAFAGVPIFDALASHLHTTTQKIIQMVSANKITVQDVFDSIQSGSGPAFAKINGMMDKQSATLSGKWSNLKDSLSQTFGHLFEPLLTPLGKVVDWVGKKIPNAIDYMKKKWHELQDFLVSSGFVKDVKDIVASMNFGDSLKNIKKDAQEFVKTVKDHWPEIRVMIGILVTGLALLVLGILALIDAAIRLGSIFTSVLSGVVILVTRVYRGIGRVLGAIGDMATLAAQLPGPMQSSFRKIADKAYEMRDRINNAIDGVNKSILIKAKEEINVVIHEQFGKIGGHASGGITGAGLSWVNETGPELVRLPTGSMVYPAGQSKQMMQSAASAASQASQGIEVSFSGSLDTAFAVLFMNMIRTGKIQILSKAIVG